MDIRKSIVAILNSDSKIVGTGFLAAPRLIVTCAHVAVDAGAIFDDDPVSIRFDGQSQTLDARLVGAYLRDVSGDDIAVLRLDAVPESIQPLPLGRAVDSSGHEFESFGYANVAGVSENWARGQILRLLDNGRLVQLDSNALDHGMSGGPVWDIQRSLVIGMVNKGKDRPGPDGNSRNLSTNHAITTELLCEVCPLFKLPTVNNLRDDLISRLLSSNEYFLVQNLDVRLPTSVAWAQLDSISSDQSNDDSDQLDLNLEERIRRYQEWYESTHSRYSKKPSEIEKIAHQNKRLVIIAGPGAGKSTSLRRLAWNLLNDRFLTVHISLRNVSLRLKGGESFEEALRAVAYDEYPNKNHEIKNMIHDLDFLLADGLDETGEMAIIVAEHLYKWGLTHPDLGVVLTTRPIGYSPSWFHNWAHYKLLPLMQEDVNKYASNIISLCIQNKDAAKKKVKGFSEELHKSKIAKIAARNPQMLGLLISLFINGERLGSSRFQLFEKIVNNIRIQTRQHREFVIICDKIVANYVIQHLAFLLLNEPDITEDAIEKNIGNALEQTVGNYLTAMQKVVNALSFWEERGLIERLKIGSDSVFVFIHAAFQEFLAAKHLAETSDQDLENWILQNHKIPKYRETMLMLGSTKKVNKVIQTLLETSDFNDPVSTTYLLVIGIIAERKASISSLPDKMLKVVLDRLMSNIPSVVYETTFALLPIAEIFPDLLGPIALKLSSHPDTWVIEAACALGLSTREKYVDSQCLLKIYPLSIKRAMPSTPSTRNAKYVVDLSFNTEIKEILLIKGGEYLLQHNSAQFKQIVLERYKHHHEFSLRVMLEFEMLLREAFPPDEFAEITPRKFPDIDTSLIWENTQASFEQDLLRWRFFFNVILTALPDYDNKERPTPDKYWHSLSQFCSEFDLVETLSSEMNMLPTLGVSDELVEVMRCAVYVSGVSPMQLKAETEKAILGATLGDIYEIVLNNRNEQRNVVNTLANKYRPNFNLLLKGLLHPVWFVGHFAAKILQKYSSEDEVVVGLKKIIRENSAYALVFVAHLAQDIWGDDAGILILDRLETNFTDECAPLINLLGDIVKPDLIKRASLILRQGLESKNERVVDAALTSIEKLKLQNEFESGIKAAYYRWSENPNTSQENVAKSLLIFRSKNNLLGLDEMKNATKSTIWGIKNEAIRIIVEKCVTDESIFQILLEDIEQDNLTSQILVEFGKNHSFFCKYHLEDFTRLLDSKNQQVKISTIQVLGNKVFKSENVEKKLRSLLESSPDIEIRDRVLTALRDLNSLP